MREGLKLLLLVTEYSILPYSVLNTVLHAISKVILDPAESMLAPPSAPSA